MNDSVFAPLWRPTLVRLWNSPYARFFFIFVALQLLFLFGVANGWVPGGDAHAGAEAAQTAFFIVSVHTLLCVNTICFLVHVTPVVSHIQHVCAIVDDDKRVMKDASRAFIVFFVVSVFASGCISLLVVLEWFGFIHHRYWKPIISLTEFVSLTLFVYFLLADFACLEICLRALRTPAALSSSERLRVATLARELKRYILAVDTPGVVGLALIVICSKSLRAYIPDMYWEGFIAGAVGLHILFSQAALALLGILEDGEASECGVSPAIAVPVTAVATK